MDQELMTGGCLVFPVFSHDSTSRFIPIGGRGGDGGGEGGSGGGGSSQPGLALAIIRP